MKLKKRLSGFCSLLAGAFVLFAFASCADVAGSKETGSVSFTFGQDFVERISAAARAAENSDDAGDSSSEIESTLTPSLKTPITLALKGFSSQQKVDGSLNSSKYLEKGHKVKASIRFKGREMAHTDLGRDVLLKFADALSDVSTIEQKPILDGRNMTMILMPKK